MTPYSQKINLTGIIIQASSVMKESINHVGDAFGLPNGWLNIDFMSTASYTPELTACSEYYKTFSNIMNVRTVAGEDLIAMKLMSGRKYKNDLSDVVGILREHQKRGNPISMDQINYAAARLYGGWDRISEAARVFIGAVVENGDYEALYQQYRAEELTGRKILLDFEENYPDAANEKNIIEGFFVSQFNTDCVPIWDAAGYYRSSRTSQRCVKWEFIVFIEECRIK